MDVTSILMFIACLTLLKISHEDWKNQLINTNYSYYMYGVTTFAYLMNNLILQWMILVLIVTFLLPQIKKRSTNLMKAGDWTVLSWLIPIIVLINIQYFMIWCFLFSGTLIAAKIVWKQNSCAGTPLMLIATLITWYIMFLFPLMA